MIARAGGYYRSAFQGFRGVTQGETLTPTIFNVVVALVVRNWVEVMVEGAGGQGERGKEGSHQNSLFYLDDGILPSSYPVWI